jgi:hypothetical protein
MRWNCLLCILTAAAELGCQPSIGDPCVQSTDCSIRGDRLCDTSQPGGYCTVLQCLGNTCPSGASCVALNPAVPGCSYDDRRSPSRSTYSRCLKQCNSNSDCRYGYSCQDIRESPWNGRPLDNGIPGQTTIFFKMCVVGMPDDASTTVTNQPPVCQPGGPVQTPIDGGPDAASDAGSEAGSEAGADAGNEAGDAATD